MSSLQVEGQYLGYIGRSVSKNTLKFKMTLNNGYWSDEYATIGKVVTTGVYENGTYNQSGPLYIKHLTTDGVSIYQNVDIDTTQVVVTDLADPITVSGTTKYRTLILGLSGTISHRTGSMAPFYAITSYKSTSSSIALVTTSGSLFEAANANITKLSYTMPSSRSAKPTEDKIRVTYHPSSYLKLQDNTDSIISTSGINVYITDTGFYAFANNIPTSAVYFKDEDGNVISSSLLTCSSIYYDGDSLRLRLTAGSSSGTNHTFTVHLRPSAFIIPTDSDIDVNMNGGRLRVRYK